MSLCVVLLGILPPRSLLAAPEGRPRTYIVTLDTVDAGQTIRLSNSAGRQRMRLRAAATRSITRRIVAEHGLRTRHRYSTAIAGFSARLTHRQAAALRARPDVVTVRPARRFRLAVERMPAGISRVKGAPLSSPTPDVDVDVAIIDTGVGPVGGNELNIAGGINCSADGLGADQWQDLYSVWHGTHVAGTVGARDGNGIGVVGVAPGARLWSVRVFDQGGWGDESTVLCGLDWATSTRLPAGAPPGSQPIEVINMSIEGVRVSGTEECLPGDVDLIHVAVCAATAAGITVVAAAGNGGIDASGVVPASYDQVITVGAISDFDGTGWGDAAADCSGEHEDTWASYSNHGLDVDILAPGSCVESLRPSPSGDETKRLTGTSMAAPHVTGAVARYLASHPGTPPALMRDLVVAAGRLDWQIRTDPGWSGVADPDDPHRLLDAAALNGPPDLRVWLSIESFKVSGASTRRQARVDVQRGGGYGGDVWLSLDGLRRKVGSASFDLPGAHLTGLSGLDARLTLELARDGRDGRRQLQVSAAAPGGPAGSRTLELLVDRTGPKITDVWPRLYDSNAPVGQKGAAKAVMHWTVADRLSAVAATTLQRRKGEGPWRTVGTAPGRTRVTLRPGRTERFRVHATDSLGNDSRSPVVGVALATRDSSSAEWQRPSGGWKTRATRSAFGGSLVTASSSTEALVTEVAGSSLAIIAPVGPKRGSFRLRLDEGPWREVSLQGPASQAQRVVYSRRLPPGRHSLEIRGSTGQAALDAILITR
jgi:hypothetical protein